MPDEDQIKDRIDFLVTEIKRHNELYYNSASPVISDREYDQLHKELEQLEKEHPQLTRLDSPTHTVGAKDEEDETFPDVVHTIPMLSISNTYTDDEVRKFVGRTIASLKYSDSDCKVEFVVELKIDGLAISLLYENGKLTQAVTRGDGKTGKDVTGNIRRITDIPEKLCPIGDGLFQNVPERLEIRGEVYMPRTSFEKLRKEQEESGADRVFANPRNAAAGTLKTKDAEVVAHRGLSAWLYHAIGEGLEVSTHFAALNLLKESGVPVNPHKAICKNADEIFAIRNKWDKLRHELPYDTDGLVIKINNLAQQKRLGLGTKSPNWAIAYKFEPEQAETTIRNIRLQVGKLGTVTPVADLEPVFLSGSTISHASLHNATYIKEKDIRVGDRVLIEKAGEIIPQVVCSLPEKRESELTKFSMPERCPVCSTPIKLTENRHGERIVQTYFCPNPLCAAKIRGQILHFVSRDCMDIEGFGPAVIDQLLEKGLIADSADLYKLRHEDISPLERLAEKSADNLMKSLEESKSRGLARLLTSLSIPNLGSTASQLISAHFGTIDRIIKASAEEIATINAGESTSYRTLGNRSANILYKALHKNSAKPSPEIKNAEALSGAIADLKISGFGKKRIDAIAAKYGSTESILAASQEELAMTELGSGSVKRTLGPVVAENLRAWLDSDNGKNMLSKLRQAGVIMEAAQFAANSGASGKVFVLTGTLTDMGRAEAKKIIEAAGGRVASSVSGNIDYLVAGEKAGSKLDRATELGITVIDKDKMLELCGKNNIKLNDNENYP